MYLLFFMIFLLIGNSYSQDIPIDLIRNYDNLIENGLGPIIFTANMDSMPPLRVHEGIKQEYKIGVGVSNNIDIFFAYKRPKLFFSIDSTQNAVFPNSNERKILYEEEKRIFDGEKTKILSYTRSDDDLIFKPNANIFDGKVINNWYNPFYAGIYILGTPVSDFLQGTLYRQNGNFEFDKVDFVRTEVIGDVICEVFVGQIISEDMEITVWIASERMYRPVRIEYRFENNSIRVNTNHRKHPNGIWFPEAINQEITINGIPEISTLKVGDGFQVNTDVPDSLFVLNFPEGLPIAQ